MTRALKEHLFQHQLLGIMKTSPKIPKKPDIIIIIILLIIK